MTETTSNCLERSYGTTWRVGLMTTAGSINKNATGPVVAMPLVQAFDLALTMSLVPKVAFSFATGARSSAQI